MFLLGVGMYIVYRSPKIVPIGIQNQRMKDEVLKRAPKNLNGKSYCRRGKARCHCFALPDLRTIYASFDMDTGPIKQFQRNSAVHIFFVPT